MEIAMDDTETIGFRMVLHEGKAREYEKRHDEIWPELVAALRDAGVLDFRIFLDAGTHHLFAVMTRQKHHRLDRLRNAPVMRRWWAMMADIMETHADASPREFELKEVFCMPQN